MTEKPSPLALVIDDQSDIRDVIRLALTHEGWRVREAANGCEGFEIARDEVPDLIMIDLMMPMMTGIEFCRKVTGELGMVDTPILLISGVNQGAKVLKDFREMPLRRKHFLHKPFSVDELFVAIQALVPGFKSPGDAAPTPALAPPGSVPPPPSWLTSAPTPASARTPPPPSSGPAAAPRPSASAPTPKPASSFKMEEHLRGYRVLVIDDDPDICAIMQTALGYYHTVQTAGNGMEGLEQLDRFAPDFVICDINMPVMNGLETVEAIRRHPVMCRVPVFFLTAETEASLPRRAFDLGANLYLRKPLDPMRLLKNIDFFLKETGLRPAAQAPASSPHASAAPGVLAPAGPAVAASGPLRILIVDFNIENQRLLRELLEERAEAAPLPGGPFETLWTEDPRHALGNLVRWEPDLILYNPRNPGLDGVAFGQTLLLQKLSGLQQVAFIGTRFYEVDFAYSRQHFQREVIGLDAARSTIEHQLSVALTTARARLRPKRFRYEQLKAEEAERRRALQATNARHAREREVLRQRYSGIQDFIDKQF